jgi:glycosyltransferase involved in cell wall biosynthesis
MDSKPTSISKDLPLAGRKLLICEEALVDYNAHFYSWIKAIRRIHLDAGAEVLVAGNQKMRPEIEREFHAIRAFSRNNWGLYNQPQAWRRHVSVFAHNALVWREGRRLFRQTGPVDTVVLPAVRVHHLMGWRALCAAGSGRWFRRVVLFLLTSQAVYDENFKSFTFNRNAALIRLVLKSFAGLVRNGTVVLAGDSHITCAEYEQLTGVPFRVFPSPGAGLSVAADAPAARNADPVFVLLGVSSYDKGIDVLQAAVLRLLAQNPNLRARFVIQWGAPTIDQTGRRILIDERLRAAPQVTILNRVLSDEEYRTWFSRADFLVLPYRRFTYFNRISGVAVEAACAGKPMIVTENTWLAWAMREFGTGLEVKDGDVNDLCRALDEAVARAPELLSTAQQRRSVALNANSTARYLKCLWD